MLSALAPQQPAPDLGLDMLSKADSLPPLAELWDVFHGGMSNDAGASVEELLEPAAKAARQTEADAFFEQMFPWLSDIAMAEHGSDTGRSGSSADSPEVVALPSPQTNVHDGGMSRSSTASACTSELGAGRQPSHNMPHAAAMSLGDYVKQEEMAQQQRTGSSLQPYDLAASAAAAAAKAMAFTSSSMAPPVTAQRSMPASANNVMVEGSTASLVSWGPPQFQQAQPAPPGPVPASAFASITAGPPGSVLVPTPASAAATSHMQGTGDSFRLSNTGGGVPLAAGPSNNNICSPFLPPNQPSDPALSHLLFDDSLIDQSLRLTTAGSARLSKKSSNVSAGSAAAAAGPSNSGLAKAASGGRGGRRTSNPAAPAGRQTTGVIKDTTRRKAAEIARLEEEVQQKLRIVSDLEREREELERRERLLKLQVSAGERHLFCQSIKGITPHLKNLIQGFRTSFNQMLANDLLAQMPEDPKKFSIKELMVTWQSYVHEIAGLMMEDPNSGNMCQDVCERIANFCMSVCIHAPSVMLKAASTNMQTGEEEVPAMEVWEEVVSKLDLSEHQAADLRSIYNLYSSMLQQATAEFHSLVLGLSKLVDQDLSRGNVLNTTSACTEVLFEASEKKEQIFKQLEVCTRRGHMLHTMLSFMVMSTLEPRQRAVMVFSAFPAFPNLKMIVAVVHKSFVGASGANPAQGPLLSPRQ